MVWSGITREIPEKRFYRKLLLLFLLLLMQQQIKKYLFQISVPLKNYRSECVAQIALHNIRNYKFIVCIVWIHWQHLLDGIRTILVYLQLADLTISKLWKCPIFTAVYIFSARDSKQFETPGILIINCRIIENGDFIFFYTNENSPHFGDWT